MNEQTYKCPWCGAALDIEPVPYHGQEYVKLFCPNGVCYDSNAPQKSVPSMARKGVIGVNVDDAFSILRTLKGGAPEGGFGGGVIR